MTIYRWKTQSWIAIFLLGGGIPLYLATLRPATLPSSQALAGPVTTIVACSVERGGKVSAEVAFIPDRIAATAPQQVPSAEHEEMEALLASFARAAMCSNEATMRRTSKEIEELCTSSDCCIDILLEKLNHCGDAHVRDLFTVLLGRIRRRYATTALLGLARNVPRQELHVALWTALAQDRSLDRPLASERIYVPGMWECPGRIGEVDVRAFLIDILQDRSLPVDTRAEVGFDLVPSACCEDVLDSAMRMSLHPSSSQLEIVLASLLFHGMCEKSDREREPEIIGRLVEMINRSDSARFRYEIEAELGRLVTARRYSVVAPYLAAASQSARALAVRLLAADLNSEGECGFAFQAIVGRLRLDESTIVRLSAIQAMAASRNPNALGELCWSASFDPESEVRIEAVNRIAASLVDRQERLDALSAVIGGVSDPQVRDTALRLRDSIATDLEK